MKQPKPQPDVCLSGSCPPNLSKRVDRAVTVGSCHSSRHTASGTRRTLASSSHPSSTSSTASSTSTPTWCPQSTQPVAAEAGGLFPPPVIFDVDHVWRCFFPGHFLAVERNEVPCVSCGQKRGLFSGFSSLPTVVEHSTTGWEIAGAQANQIHLSTKRISFRIRLPSLLSNYVSVSLSVTGMRCCVVISVCGAAEGSGLKVCHTTSGDLAGGAPLLHHAAHQLPGVLAKASGPSPPSPSHAG